MKSFVLFNLAFAQRLQPVEQYPPVDYSNPIVPECEDEVSKSDCTRLLSAKLYTCDKFTEAQKRSCQATCNLCGIYDEPEPEPSSAPPEPAIDVMKATNDDFVELNNDVDEFNDDEPLPGVLPDHGQVKPKKTQPGIAPPPGMVPPGYPYPGFGMHPGMYPVAPYQPPYGGGARPPAWAQAPSSAKPTAGPNGKPTTRMSDIRGGAANVNVPVMGGDSLPGMLLPLWAVILICLGIILLLISVCWISVKIHSCWLRRKHQTDMKRLQKDTDVTVAQLKTELSAMKKLAEEKAKNIEETKERGVDIESTDA